MSDGDMRVQTGGMNTVSSGRFFTQVSKYLAPDLGVDLKARMEARLADLKAGGTLFNIGLATGLAVASDEEHVTDDIFGSDWWVDEIAAQSESIVRAAYMHAIQLSLEYAAANNSPPLPIQSLWMVQDSEVRFEVHVVMSGAQVTLILVTPRPPRGQTVPPIAHAFDEDTWVIGSEAQLVNVRNKYPDAYKPRLVIEPIPGDPGSVARKMRILGF